MYKIRLEWYGQQPIQYVFHTDLADTIHIQNDTHVHDLRFQNQEFQQQSKCFGLIYTVNPTNIVLKQNDHISLLVACVKSHHARPSILRDTTLHRQLKVIQTDGSICKHNIPFVSVDYCIDSVPIATVSSQP